jgi:hypothetical protein
MTAARTASITSAGHSMTSQRPPAFSSDIEVRHCSATYAGGAPLEIRPRLTAAAAAGGGDAEATGATFVGG